MNETTNSTESSQKKQLEMKKESSDRKFADKLKLAGYGSFNIAGFCFSPPDNNRMHENNLIFDGEKIVIRPRVTFSTILTNPALLKVKEGPTEKKDLRNNAKKRKEVVVEELEIKKSLHEIKKQKLDELEGAIKSIEEIMNTQSQIDNYDLTNEQAVELNIETKEEEKKLKLERK